MTTDSESTHAGAWGSAALGQNEGFGETQKEAPTPEPSVSQEVQVPLITWQGIS